MSYSRIHTGVHFPGDVVAGALIGAVVADVTGSVLGRRLGLTAAPTGDRTVPPRRRPYPDDVTRRTHLANERTYLAWWRTGLGCLAAGIGAGRVVPCSPTSRAGPT